FNSQGARQIGIELTGRDWRAADITLVWRFVKAARNRSAGAMRLGEISAAIPGIVRRRLQPASLFARAAEILFPSPLWGGDRGWGGMVRRLRRALTLRLATPLPTLPHKGGGSRRTF